MAIAAAWDGGATRKGWSVGKEVRKTFGAMYGEIQSRVVRLRGQVPHHFSLPAGTQPFIDMPDAHSVAIVAAHEGVPLSRVRLGIHHVHDEVCQVNPEPLERYRTAVQSLVAML